MKTLTNLIDVYTVVQSGFYAGNNSVGDVCEAGEAIKNFHAQAVKDAEKRGLEKARDLMESECLGDAHRKIEEAITNVTK